MAAVLVARQVAMSGVASSVGVGAMVEHRAGEPRAACQAGVGSVRVARAVPKVKAKSVGAAARVVVQAAAEGMTAVVAVWYSPRRLGRLQGQPFRQ